MSLRRRQSVRGLSQKELYAAGNSLGYGQSGNMYKHVDYPANTPQKWMLGIRFAGIDGFWPEPWTPVVMFGLMYFFMFLYQWNFASAEYDELVRECAAEAGAEYNPIDHSAAQAHEEVADVEEKPADEE